MIPFDFSYYRPDSLKEAAEISQQLASQRKTGVFYGGGSEIITLCRAGSIHPQGVIDIKKIPECTDLYMNADGLTIGAACTLNKIKESRHFPLLGLACGRIADHTNQCRITLGGNLCGTIIYRETSLPLMLSDAQIDLYGPEGQRSVPFNTVYRGRMELKPQELVLRVHIPKWALHAGYAHIKRTTNEKIDYPLVNVTALWKDNCLRTAFSGICSYPFRSKAMEALLNDKGLPCHARAEKAVSLLPEPALTNVEGSGEYRAFVFKNTLQALLEDWENGKL